MSQLMLYSEIIVVCYDNHTKRKIKFTRNVELLNFKMAVYTEHWAVKR